MMAVHHYNHLWRQAPRYGKYTFWWPGVINKNSHIAIRASEAVVSGSPPMYQIGDMRPIMVGSIGPKAEGFVAFTLYWPQSSMLHLDIWTEFTIFDPADPSGMG